jgi:class 3 adenylate cyclase
MNCGNPVGSEPEGPGQGAQIAAAAPPSLADKMRAAPVTGERKPVTAVFADVVGSTSLAEGMDP